MVTLFGVILGQEKKREIFFQIKKILKQSNDCRPVWIVTLNPEILLKAREDREYKEILNSADWKINDGFGLQLWAFLKKKKIGERLAGADLAEVILQEAFEKKIKIGFILFQEGLSSEKDLKNFLKKRKIRNFAVFSCKRELFLEDLSSLASFKDIRILLVGLGAPWQERLIFHLINNNFFSNLKLAVGVGGTFDFWTGKQKRAPVFLRKIGMEWLWRLIMQPKRFWRIWQATLIFLARAFIFKKE